MIRQTVPSDRGLHCLNMPFCKNNGVQDIYLRQKKIKNKTWNDNTPPLSCRGQITLSKIDEICPWANPKQSPQCQCTYQIWWKTIEIYWSYCPESKIWMYCKHITKSKIDYLPISNLKADLHNINAMHIPSLVKIHWYVLKLSSRNENTDSVKNWRNLPISNPKPDLHNINADTKFDENPLTFTQVIIQN